jgi:hypothetical protein
LKDDLNSDLSELRQLGIRAQKTGADGLAVQALLKDIAQIRRNLKAAKDIDWERHDPVLFPKHRRFLSSGRDCDASVRVACYARAMEIIVEQENYQRRYRYEKTAALLAWVAAQLVIR